MSSRPIRCRLAERPGSGIARTLGYDHVESICRSVTLAYLGGAVGFRSVAEKREAQSERVYRDLSAFRDPESAARALTALREGPSGVHVAPRTRGLYAKLEPELLIWFSRVAEPDAALNRFVRFVDGYGTRGLLFETMLASPKLLELLVRLFDASAIFSEVVIRRPQLIEEITRGKTLGLSPLERAISGRISAAAMKICRPWNGFASTGPARLFASFCAISWESPPRKICSSK